MFQGKDISIEEFKESELLSYYNHAIYSDLLVISNRDLHLQALTKEFIKFSSFITQPLNKKHFLVFLVPVFQHLYLLIRSNGGKSDAERFIKYFKYLPLPSDVIEELLKCETYEELQELIYGQARIRVKLSSSAYHILIKWLMDCFSESSQMFTILRVLHENFHVDIYYDKDDEDFSAVEQKVLQAIQNWIADYEAQQAQKKSGPEVSAKACKTPQSDDIEVESPKTSGTPMMPEMPTTSESNGSKGSFEIKSSMFKMRDSARKYLEKVRKSGWDMDEMEKALLNPPDPNSAVSSDSEDDPELKFLENPENTDEIAEDDPELKFLENPENTDENAVKEIIEQLLRPCGEVADYEAQQTQKESEPEVSVKSCKTPQSDGSEYVIWSDASTKGNDEDEFQVMDIINVKDQDPYYDNDEDNTVIQQNDETTEQDMSDVTTEDEDNQDNSKLFFEDTYKTNFHSAYPITISGEDVLSSSDVSSDLLYLACGFQSGKICTWRLCHEEISNNEFILQPLGTLRGHEGIVYALSIDSNRKTLISGSHDCTVRIWDLEESTCLSTISAHSAPVYTVCVSPNSKYFLSASNDLHVVLFWYDDVYPVRVYSGHSMEAINCVKFHPNCLYFASASSDGNVFLFKINYDNCPVRMFHKHVAKVYTIAFSPCGKHLASADVEGLLVIWDILTYEPIKTCETGQGIRSIAYDTSGSFLAALFYFKSWKIFSVEETDIDVVIEADSVGVPKSVHFSMDNKMIIIQYIEANKSEID